MRKRLQGKVLVELVYMVTNDLPDAYFDKQLGYTEIELGFATQSKQSGFGDFLNFVIFSIGL